MATIERFESLLAKAEHCAQQALDAGNSTVARGQWAQLAAMWLDTARLEHQILTADRLEARTERLTARVKALEQRAGMDEQPMPDPFDAGEADDEEVDEVLDDELGSRIA